MIQTQLATAIVVERLSKKCAHAPATNPPDHVGCKDDTNPPQIIHTGFGSDRKREREKEMTFQLQYMFLFIHKNSTLKIFNNAVQF
jgi:hypothetical protein